MTTMPKAQEISRKWYIIDAANRPLGRTAAAAAAILRGSVFVNDIEAKKPDARLEPGDKLVLRGAGKAVFSAIAGTTRKGRLSVRFQKYK